jgi:creatinine amidohydrolase/Fe(II)-dependent formamide hydrolase-like protein
VRHRLVDVIDAEAAAILVLSGGRAEAIAWQARNGIRKLVILNGHGGNVPALQFAAQMINRDAHIFTCVDTGESSDADVGKLAATHNDVHAGEIETSTTMALRRTSAHGARAQARPRSAGYLDFNSARSVGGFAHRARLPGNVVGTRAPRAKAGAVGAMIRNLGVRRAAQGHEPRRDLAKRWSVRWAGAGSSSA